nr:hypothetical protein [Tanacetum cinerariifolium]
MSSASLQSPTLLSKVFFSRGGYVGELMRSCRTEDEDEREPMFIQPHDPDYVLEPMYPEYIPLEDEHVLPAKEQPLPPIDSPTAESPRYVAESDSKEDPKEYEDDETEDGPIDYPMDGGDNGDDDDSDSFRDDTDDKDEDEEDDEITIRLQAAISLPPEAEVERLLAMPTLPPSPLTSQSPPSTGERLARMASFQALIDAVTAALPSPPLPPPLYIPPPIDRRDDIPETEMPPRKRLCLFTLGCRYEIKESSTNRPTRSRDRLWASSTDGRDSSSYGRMRQEMDDMQGELLKL